MLNGIALEKDVPNMEYSKEDYSILKTAPVNKVVTNGIILSNSMSSPILYDDIITMKNHIINNGGLFVSIPSPDEGTNYYDSNSNSFYWNGDSNLLIEDRLSHSITIVGWDDNYPINQFESTYQPSKPGAFIALNSWGKEFGENGYFYISYESWYLEYEIIGITDTKDVDYSNTYSHSNFVTLDNMYEYIPIIYDEEQYYSKNRVIYDSIYFANIFKKKETVEYLSKIILLADKDAMFDIYVNAVDGNLNTDNYVFVKTQKANYSGLIVISLDTPLKLTGNEFAIAIKITGKNIGCFDLDTKNYTYVSLSLNQNWKQLDTPELLKEHGNYRNIPIVAYTHYKYQ